ncbi:MAG: hypothetical protein ACPLQO_11370, partial [Desulfotomaculales bacterium]
MPGRKIIFCRPPRLSGVFARGGASPAPAQGYTGIKSGGALMKKEAKAARVIAGRLKKGDDLLEA